ncbi:hypothetical protein BsWGS_11915 [Bradybaena similaris]
MQLVYFSVFVAVINVGVCQECPQDWLHFQGHCYGYGDTAVSWGNAQAICQSQGATLAEIPTLEVNNFLSTIARNKRDNCVWLGGNDIFHEGVWEWSSRRNTFYSFRNWKNGEPNNNNNDEDCLNMFKRHNYFWNDESCNTNCNFICAAVANHISPNVELLNSE